MKWDILEHCGNSPKNKMLVDWIVALVEQDDDMNFVAEDSVIVFKGKSSSLLDFEIPTGIDEMQIKQAITHGRIGSILGRAVVGDQKYPFSLFFEFSLGKQPKIKTIDCIIDQV